MNSKKNNKMTISYLHLGKDPHLHKLHNDPAYERLCFLNKAFNLKLISYFNKSSSVNTFFTNNVLLINLKLLYKLIKTLYFSKKYGEKNEKVILYTPIGKNSIIFGFISSKIFRVPWVVDIWDFFDLQLLKGNIIQRLIFNLLLILMKNSNLYIIAMHPYLAKLLEIPPERCIFITNGFNKERSKIENTNSKRVKRKQTFDIVYVVRRFDKTRELDKAVIAMHYIKKKGIKNVRLHIVGEIPTGYKREINFLIEKYNLERDVILYGLQPHKRVVKIVSNADVCLNLLSSEILNYRYAYPIKIFEYLSMGKVVLSTETLGVSDIIIDGYSGILIEKNNPKLIATKIEQLYFCPKLRKKIGINALKSTHKYKWGNIHGKLYKKLSEKVSCL